MCAAVAAVFTRKHQIQSPHCKQNTLLPGTSMAIEKKQLSVLTLCLLIIKYKFDWQYMFTIYDHRCLNKHENICKKIIYYPKDEILICTIQ